MIKDKPIPAPSAQNGPFWKNPIVLICAAGFALFHLLTVVQNLISTGGKGEGQGFLVLFLDFPLFVLFMKIPWDVLRNSTMFYILYFSIAGTIMYALIGFLVGWSMVKGVLYLDRRLTRRS